MTKNIYTSVCRSVFSTFCFIVAYSGSFTIQAANSNSLPAGLSRQESKYQLIDVLQTNPPLGKTPPDSNGKYTITPRVTNRSTRVGLNQFSINTARTAQLSSLDGKKTDFTQYPSGSALFPGKPQLAQSLESLVQMLQENPDFIKFYRKVHLNVLNELYDYLMKIYTNFNLHHKGSSDVDGKITTDIVAFMENEATYALNKKTLLINHLVNIIEAQCNSAVRALLPKVPHLTATHTGRALIQSDFSVDLTAVLTKQESAFLSQEHEKQLQQLGQYLLFFEEYTNYINQAGPVQGINEFANIAQHLADFLGDDIDTMLTKTDPPLFFFDQESIRALKIIPQLILDMPTSTKQVIFPEEILHAAGTMQLAKVNSGVTSVAAHPIAYFKDQYGNVVTQDISQARSLYMVTMQGQTLFEQELLLEPDWMMNISEATNILRGCLGDIRALLGYNIIDPCTEAIIDKAYSLASGKPENQNIQQRGQQWIQYIKSEQLKPYGAQQNSGTNTNTSSHLQPTFDLPVMHGSLTSDQQNILQSQIQNMNTGTPSSNATTPIAAPSDSDISS